jgi:hypothetical protein
VETSSKAKVEIYKVLGDKFEFAKKTLKEYLVPGSGVIEGNDNDIFDKDNL